MARFVLLAAAFAGVASALGPAFSPSAATCSGVHTLAVGMMNGKRNPESNLVTAVEDQIGISANLKWANLNEQYFGCSDGRARSPLITTPGGDLGEFIRALTVMSAKAGKVYTDADVKSRLADFLKHNPVKRFAMCTDQKAMGALIEATSVAEADFDITKPPPAFPSAALPMLTEPKFNGDPTLINMLNSPKEMFVSPELPKQAIKAFFQLMWDKTNDVHKRLHLVVADGVHSEVAAVVLTTSDKCAKEAVNPAITPNGAKSMFTMHLTGSDFLRSQMIDSLVKGDAAGLKSVVKETARASIQRIAMQNMLTVVAKTRPGVPVYDASLTSA